MCKGKFRSFTGYRFHISLFETKYIWITFNYLRWDQPFGKEKKFLIVLVNYFQQMTYILPTVNITSAIFPLLPSIKRYFDWPFSFSSAWKIQVPHPGSWYSLMWIQYLYITFLLKEIPTTVYQYFLMIFCLHCIIQSGQWKPDILGVCVCVYMPGRCRFPLWGRRAPLWTVEEKTGPSSLCSASGSMHFLET